jgi:WD40 repeat protein
MKWSRCIVASVCLLGAALAAGLAYLGLARRRPPSPPPLTLRATLGERGRTFHLPLAFSPDGKALASGTAEEGTIRLWDVSTGECIATLKWKGGDVSSLAFIPDGKVLAAGMKNSGGTAVRLWDAGTRKPMAAFKGQGADCVAFSPNGKSLAAGCTDETIRLWDLASGKNTVTLKSWGTYSLAFSPDGKMLASASPDCAVKLWDPAPGKTDPLHQWTISPDDAFSVAFSPDGTALAAGGGWSVSLSRGSGSLYLWDLASRQERVSFRVGEQCECFVSVAFSPDGTSLAAGNWDGQVLVWDTSMGKLIAAGWHSCYSPAQAVTFSPDGTVLASGGGDGQVKLWDVPGGR